MEQEIIEVLQSHPNWANLMNEYEGSFIMEYVYRGIRFWVFNEVGGSVYVGIAPDSIEVASSQRDVAREFADVATCFFRNQGR